MYSVNANLDLGLQYGRGRSRNRRNRRRAAHNGRIAMQLGHQNVALRQENQQLRSMLQQYQGGAHAAQQQCGSSHALCRGFQAGFAQSQASLMQGSVLGAIGALTSGNVGGLLQLSAGFSGSAAFSLGPARANFFQLAAHQHAHSFHF